MNNVLLDNNKVNLVTVQTARALSRLRGKKVRREECKELYYVCVHGFGSVLAGSLKKLNNFSRKLVAQMTVANRYCFLISLEYGVLLKSKI